MKQELSLEKIQEKIGGLEESSRYEGWFELYYLEGPRAAQLISQYLSGTDLLIKKQALKFFSEIYEKKSVEYIIRLLKDPAPALFQIAKRAFEKNQYFKKNDLLFHILDSNDDTSEAYKYAVEMLAMSNHVDLLEYLEFKITEADLPLLMIILDALRYFSDSRMIDWVVPFLREDNDEVRLRTLLVLAKVYENGGHKLRKYFVSGLQDRSPKVRKIAVWGLRRQKISKDDISLLIKISKEDPDIDVRLEALNGMSVLPGKHVLYHLFELLSGSQSKIILLKVESILLSLNMSSLMKGLKLVLKSPNHKVSERPLVFMASIFPSSGKLLAKVLKKLEQSDNNKDRLPLIEALGHFDSETVTLTLESYLKGNPLLAYSAMSGILRRCQKKWDNRIWNYLEDQSLPSIIRQEILHFISETSLIRDISSKMEMIIRIYLKDPLPNMRYLALKVVEKHGSFDVLSSLIDFYSHEKNEDNKTLCGEVIKHFLKKSPKAYIDILKLLIKRGESRVHMVDFLQRVYYERDDALELTKMFWHDDEIEKNLDDSFKAKFYWHLLFSRRITFEDILSLHDATGKLESTVSLIIHNRPSILNIKFTLPWKMLFEWYENRGPLSQKTILGLAGLAEDTGPFMSLVANAYCSNDRMLKSAAKDVLNLSWKEAQL